MVVVTNTSTTYMFIYLYVVRLPSKLLPLNETQRGFKVQFFISIIIYVTISVSESN